MATKEPFLRQVYAPKSPDTPNIDFVFVHGLNPSGRDNHPFETWTHAESRTLWPQKFLSKDFPKARIWIFGYNSKVTRDVSAANISDHANNLLGFLRWKRQGSGDPSKIPIIFLGHSLGGLVIKQALLNARDDPDNYLETWNASCGLVFFGTPHRGGNTGALEEFAARLAKLFANDSTANDLLMCLKPNSLFTQHSTQRFSKQLKNFKILTFFETRPTKFHGFSKIVVNRDSAILNAPDEVCVDLDRNHRDICKFETRENAYDTVKGNLSDIVAWALASIGQALPSNQESPRGMNENTDSGLRKSIAWSQAIPQRRSQSTIKSRNSEPASANYSSLTFVDVEELNDRFLEAVKELDTLLIHNWIKDPDRRPNLKLEHVQSALLDLTSLKEPTEERFQAEAEHFRDQAVSAILEECDPDLECLDDEFKATPLISAALCGREDITKLLIEAGASLQATDGILGRTGLSWAARNNFVETAKILLKALDENQDRQTVQSKDVDGHTAFDLANRNGHKYMARLIKSRSRSLNVSYASGLQCPSSSQISEVSDTRLS